MLGGLAYCTFFIHIDDFNDRFMGSLTALLVLASMMPVFTGDLPKASYTKVGKQSDWQNNRKLSNS